MKYKDSKNNKGFVILFAVTISAILLSIALGVANISFREIQFGTSAKDTNEAFFAADTGAECALYYDRTAEDKNAFTGTASMVCAGNPSEPTENPPGFWKFTLLALGSQGQACAVVTLEKTDNSDGGVDSKLVSKGYNTGSSSGCIFTPGPKAVQRELELTY